jgi:hypothetical protein
MSLLENEWRLYYDSFKLQKFAEGFNDFMSWEFKDLHRIFLNSLDIILLLILFFNFVYKNII